jgi:hypothetical protein
VSLTVQDAFLPHVESGLITLVGATTENPSFALNRALLSRCRVHCLERLSHEDICTLLVAAQGDHENGVMVSQHSHTPEARDHQPSLRGHLFHSTVTSVPVYLCRVVCTTMRTPLPAPSLEALCGIARRDV